MSPTGPIEAEFKSASNSGPVWIGLAVCLLIGFASSTVAMVLGHTTAYATAAAFVAVPFVLLIFYAVHRAARTPSVIVSDRGLETSSADVTRVVPWADVAAVELVCPDDETTRIRYLTNAGLESAVHGLLAGEPGAGATPDARGSDAGDAEAPGVTDVEHLMRLEDDVLADLAGHGLELPRIPRSDADEAAAEWDELLRRYGGARYRGIVRD